MKRQVTPEHHQVALDMLVAKLREDRHVLAAILFGSLAHGEAWEKSDIDLVAFLRDSVERERGGYWLVENGGVFRQRAGYEDYPVVEVSW